MNKVITLNILKLILFISYYSFAQSTYTFNYTGNIQTWTVPAGVCEIKIKAWGAGGGGGGTDSYSPGNGGNGGYAEGTFTVNPGDNLSIYVGQGGLPGVPCASNGAGGLGGWG
ncbi:MAG: hypothetical protein D6799_05770, partial [Bacteroidetes bacterium]